MPREEGDYSTLLSIAVVVPERLNKGWDFWFKAIEKLSQVQRRELSGS